MATARPLTVLAWVNVVLHLIGLAFAALGMRPGTPLMPLADRLAYLSRAPLGWSLGWGTWMLCTTVLIAFLAVLARRLGDDLARLGLTFAIVGGAFDLFFDSVYILVFPLVASWQPEALFLALERLSGVGSLVIANGLYSIATLLFTLSLRGREGVSRLTFVVGYAVTGFGLLLAAAGFTGVPWHAEWATGPTIGCFCLWAVLVAHGLERDGGKQ
jgi:hypothetical protein